MTRQLHAISMLFPIISSVFWRAVRTSFSPAPSSPIIRTSLPSKKSMWPRTQRVQVRWALQVVLKVRMGPACKRLSSESRFRPGYRSKCSQSSRNNTIWRLLIGECIGVLQISCVTSHKWCLSKTFATWHSRGVQMMRSQILTPCRPTMYWWLGNAWTKIRPSIMTCYIRHISHRHKEVTRPNSSHSRSKISRLPSNLILLAWQIGLLRVTLAAGQAVNKN